MRPQLAPQPPAAYDDVRRVLVVANETVGSEELHDLLLGTIGGGRDTQVLVIVPALAGRLLTLPPHLDGAGGTGRAALAAEERLQLCLEDLAAEGVTVAGHLVDVDPLLAISQTLREFRADLVVIATHPPHRSVWMAHDLVARADRAFGLPVAHVVVDHDALGLAAA